jgi:hypothetical protein
LPAAEGYSGELIESVLGAIRAHDFDEDGWSSPSQELIGQELGVTRFTVLRIVRILRDLGLLVVAKAQRKGHWPHNRYWIPPNAVRVFRKPLLALLKRLGKGSVVPMSHGRNRLSHNKRDRDPLSGVRREIACSQGARAGPAQLVFWLGDEWRRVSRMRALLVGRGYDPAFVNRVVAAAAERLDRERTETFTSHLSVRLPER